MVKVGPHTYLTFDSSPKKLRPDRGAFFKGTHEPRLNRRSDPLLDDPEGT